MTGKAAHAAFPRVHMEDTVQIVCLLYLLASGVLVVYYDLRFNSIPNMITYAGILLGLLVAVFFRRDDLMNYVGAFLVGGGVFYAMFLCGWFGGGDVKLVAMIGLLMGGRFLLDAVVFMTVAGGVIALFYVIGHLLRRKPLRGAKIPYGTAIVAGTYFNLYHSML